MDTDTVLNYLQLTGNLTAAVEDTETFKLVALVTLFSGKAAESAAGASSSSSTTSSGGGVTLADLGRKYDRILERRSAAAAAAAVSETTDAESDFKAGRKADYSKIRVAMSSVDELAAIFEKLQTY